MNKLLPPEDIIGKLDVFKDNQEITLNINLKEFLIYYLSIETRFIKKEYKISKNKQSENKQSIRNKLKSINNFELFVNIEQIKYSILSGFIDRGSYKNIYIDNTIIEKSEIKSESNTTKRFNVFDNKFKNLNDPNVKNMMYIILTESFSSNILFFINENIIFLYKIINAEILKRIFKINPEIENIKISENFNNVEIPENRIFFYYTYNNDAKFIAIYYITYSIKIDFKKNEYKLIYKCKWLKKYYIDFYYFVNLYEHIIDKKKNNNLDNITFLIKNNIDDKSVIKLFNFLTNIIECIIECIDKNTNEINIFEEILENIKTNIENNKNFDSIIIHLINDINLVFLIKSNNILFNIIFKNIPKKILNKIYQIKTKNKNENKNENKEIDNDFLIINYNEDNKKCSNNIINNIILKIFFENPSFIIISTQNCNKEEKTQYQYILCTILKKNGYIELVKNNNKTLSMIIYYNEKKVIFNKKKSNYFNIKSIFKTKENLSIKSNDDLNLKNSTYYKRALGIKQNKYYIKSYEIKQKKYETIEVIVIHLEISFINNYIDKFIFINCNFSDKNKDKFKNIVNDFKLIKYYKENYNIFFCGNFNINNKNNKNNQNELLNFIKYENIKSNTLYLFLKKIITSQELYSKLKIINTREKLSKIPSNVKPQVNKIITNYIKSFPELNQEKNKEKLNEIQNVFKQNNKFLLPLNQKNQEKIIEITFYMNLLDSINKLGIQSQSNRILYALSGVSSIINFDFNVYKFPDKLTTLSFDIFKYGKNTNLETVLRINNTLKKTEIKNVLRINN